MNGLSCKLLVVLVACGFSQTVPIIPQAHSAQLIQTQFLIQSTALHFSPAIRDKERDPRVTRAVCFTSQISQLWVFTIQSREPTGLISVRHKTGHRPFTTLVFTLQRETWKRSMNNPSAHPYYSHYYLLSPSTLFFLFLYILLFFAHLVVFLHILLFFAHLIVLHFFYFIAHFTLISPFLTICMPLCYVTLYNLYSYYFALSTERTWFDCISLLIIPCITIMWQIKKPWTLNLEIHYYRPGPVFMKNLSAKSCS